MKKNTEKLMIGAGLATGAIAAAGAVSYAVTKKLVDIALDREQPETHAGSEEMLSGSPEIQEVVELQAAAAEKLEHSGCDAVEITAHDGEKMIGHWSDCDDPKRIVIAMHGWRSSWTNGFGLIADFLRENGCAVLYAEQRGQNNSGGDYMGFGLIERYDCLDWINWVNEHKRSDLPIYLAGISMGAATVLMTAGFDLPANVHGIVADCGFTSPHAIWKHIAENNLHIHYNDIRGKIADDMCRKKIQIGSGDYSCTDAMKVCKVPVLFIHGTDDHFVPIEMTYENYKACAAPKRLFIVPGAEHSMSYLTDRAGYEQAVRQFWRDFD